MPKGENENIAKSEDYQFVDPTGQFQGQLDQFNNMAQFGKAGLSGAFSQDFQGFNPEGFNPSGYSDFQGTQLGGRDAAVNAFLAQSPGLANVAQGPGAQLTQQLNALASRQANEGMQNAMTQFQGMGAGRSGAANRAMGEAAANPFAQVQAQLGGRQADLTGQLWGSALGQQGQQSLQQDQLINQALRQRDDIGAQLAMQGNDIGSQLAMQGNTIGSQLAMQGNDIGAQMTMGQNELQNALLRQRAQTMGGIYGQGMQGAGQIAGQMGGMMAPQYEYQPSPWERFMGGAQDVVGLGTDVGTAAGGLGWTPFG